MDEQNLLDYPPPDPAWEYYGIWYEIQYLKRRLDSCIKYMNDVEEPNNESDRILRKHLEGLQTKLNSAVSLLDERELPY